MAGIDELYSAMIQAVQAVNALNVAMTKVFPAATGTSSFSTVTGGVTFNSSQPIGFITVTTSSGASVKLPYFQ